MWMALPFRISGSIKATFWSFAKKIIYFSPHFKTFEIYGELIEVQNTSI